MATDEQIRKKWERDFARQLKQETARERARQRRVRAQRKRKKK